MAPNNSSLDELVPGLVSEALIQRSDACDRLLDMVSSGRGLAINPSTIGFEYGEHPHSSNERYEHQIAVNLARSNNISCYYDFERFIVEFLKRNGYFIHSFSQLVAIISSLQDYEFFRTFIVSPDETYGAIHGMELSENNIRMLLLRHGFLWSIILDDNGSISHELRLNSTDDNWSAEFISDWVIPSYLHRQVFRTDGTSIVWDHAISRNNDIK
jgi:hypothetical protein